MQKMFNFNDLTKEVMKGHNPGRLQIPEHPYRMMIVGGSGSGKTNTLLNLINHKPYTVEIYLYAKDSYEAKYQFLISNRECVALKKFDNSKAFVKDPDYMDGIYEINENTIHLRNAKN